MTFHSDGYSATVEGHFVANGERLRLAKTNATSFVLAKPRAILPGPQGELVVSIDGEVFTRRIVVIGRDGESIHYRRLS